MATCWSAPLPAAPRGTNQSSFGSWDATQLPNPQRQPRSAQASASGTQINDFSKNDGYAPYSQQWNVNVQRELPYEHVRHSGLGWATASSICPAS